MSHRVPHCPFLNRADTRCSNHFSLDRLDRAFDHCFGSYLQCGTYQELLNERKLRQRDEAGEPGAAAALAGTGPAGASHGISVISLPVLGASLAHAHR